VKSHVVLLGLPSPGLELLARQLDVHYSDPPEIRHAWDSLLDEDESLSEDWISSNLAASIEGARQAPVLLAYTSPTALLMHRLKRAAELRLPLEGLEPFVKTSLEFWLAYHLAMLEQYRQHEDRALLLNADHAIDVEAFLARMKVLFGEPSMPARTTHAATGGASHQLPRASFFQIVDTLAPECLELYAELESCAELLGREPEFDFTGPGERQIHIRDLLRLLAEQARIKQVLAGYEIDSADPVAAMETLQSGLNDSIAIAQAREREIGVLQERASELQKERDEAKQQRQQLSDQTAVSEKEKKSLQQDKESLLGQVKKLQQERDEGKKQSQQLSDKSAASEKEKKSLQEENELLLLQLHQVQEELEHYYLLSQKTEQQGGESKQSDAVSASNEQEAGVNGRDVQGTALKANASILRAAGRWFGFADKRTRTLRQHALLLRQSGYFDEAWYLHQYPDVAQSGLDPAEHYLSEGFTEGRNPGPRFDTRWYLETYPDVAQANMNPLLHFVKFGKDEGRQPKPFRA